MMEKRQWKIHRFTDRWFWIWLAVISLAFMPGASAEARDSHFLSMEKELPRLSDWEYIMTDDWPEAPEIGAEAAVLLDADSGEVLYAKNADSKYYPASITKILTALITVEEGSLSDTLVFKGDALTPLPEGYVSIEPTKGEKMLVEDCLYGMLLSSANDAANALAVYNAKTIRKFAKKMNVRAAEAGATHTHFTNPSGLAEDTHYTTAYDMAMILRACVQHPEFLEIAGSTYHLIPATNKHGEREAKMRHEMLLEDSPNFYEYCVAGKTGFTTPAGRTLVTYAEKDGIRLVCCVLKCADNEQYRSTRALFDYGFEQFQFIEGEQVDASQESLRFSKEILNRMQRDREFTLEKTGSSDLLLPGGRHLSDLEVNLRDLDPEENEGCFAEAVYCLGARVLGSSRLRFTVRDRSGEALSLVERDKKLHQLRQETEKKIRLCLAGIAGALLFLLLITVLVFRSAKRDRRRWRSMEKREFFANSEANPVSAKHKSHAPDTVEQSTEPNSNETQKSDAFSESAAEPAAQVIAVQTTESEIMKDIQEQKEEEPVSVSDKEEQ